MKRIGLLGGSFNPVHQDHLALGLFIKEKLQLDKVVLIPNATPPHKKTCKVSYKDRLNMLHLACEGINDFEISDIEKDEKVLHYSIDTVKKLHELNPNTALFFIMGLDSLLNLDKWHDGFKLTEYSNLAVMSRTGYENFNLNPQVKNFLKEHAIYDQETESFDKASKLSCGKCFMLSERLHAISSSKIREEISSFYRTKDKNYLSFLKKHLSQKVLDYILTCKLYDNQEN